MAVFDAVKALLHAYDTNGRINHYLIRAVPAEAWRLKPPNGKGRDIVSILAHMQNVRLMWLKSAGKTAVLPVKLDAAVTTPDMLARQMGHPISQSAMFGMWEWGTR